MSGIAIPISVKWSLTLDLSAMTKHRTSPPLLRVIALAMLLFGTAEVVTAFRHRFFGLRSTDLISFTVIGAVLGLCYLAAGALVLVHSKRALWIAASLLAVDVIGRISLVITGLFPVDTSRQIFGIAAGTAIAGTFGVVVALHARSLSAG